MLLLLLSFPLLKKSSFARSLLNFDHNSKSLMSGAFFNSLLRSLFFPISTWRMIESTTGFCVLKCFMSLSNNSIEFWFLIILFDTGLSFCLKLALFNLSFVTYKFFSPCISCPNLLVASKFFFTSSLGEFFKISCWKSLSWEKNLCYWANPCKRFLQNYQEDFLKSFWFFFFVYSITS